MGLLRTKLKALKAGLVPEHSFRQTALNEIKRSFVSSRLWQNSSYRNFKRKYFADEPVNLSEIEIFRAEYFPPSGPSPWLDLPNASQQIADRLQAGSLSEEQAQYCQQWVDQGVIIVRGLLNPDFLDRVWDAYEKSIQNQVIVLEPEKICEEDPFPGRYLDPHLKVPELHELLAHPDILQWIELLLGRQSVPFQTITSHKGSQQRAHSDSIHMTTYPVGYLAAAWIAFEDIHPDSGPLVYYPGSHRLPYVFSKDVGISVDEFRTKDSGVYHSKYEPAVEQLIQEHHLAAAYFEASKGDVLIWHANLLHGGSPRKNVALSRRAVVCHYFAEGAVCYHDLSGMRSRVNL